MNYWRVAVASPSLKVGDVAYNKEQIIAMAHEAYERDIDVLVFPEMALTGYTCQDLLGQNLLMESTKSAAVKLADELPQEMLTVVGAPVSTRQGLFDGALCYYRGNLVNIALKTHLANNGDSYEKRWFLDATQLQDGGVEFAGNFIPTGGLMEIRRATGASLVIGVEIGTDLAAPMPPSGAMAASGADLILCPAAFGETVGAAAYRKNLILTQSARLGVAYAYAGAGIDESSTDAAFSGSCLIAENGTMLTEGPAFHLDGVVVATDIDVELLRHERKNASFTNDFFGGPSYDVLPLFDDFFPGGFDPEKIFAPATEKAADKKKKAPKDLLRQVDAHPFIPGEEEGRADRCREITEIQAMGLVRRLRHLGNPPAVIGISGGLDSTLALLITCRAFDILDLPRTDINAITMPGLGTSTTTRSLADELIEALGVSGKAISIAEAAKQHLSDIGHPDDAFDATYENAQARERTQVLMDYANMIGGLVIGTGDLSELALGWCTFNGDHMANYGVNAGVPKTLVRYLVAGFGDIYGGKVKEVLDGILDIPISPELLPPDQAGDIAQKTEDLVGPYELHDFFLYHMLRYGEDPAKIYRLAKIAFDGSYDAATIKKWLVTFYRRFFISQFKRSCLPDGPKVGSISLSPRSDWKMPSDAAMNLWISEAESL